MAKNTLKYLQCVVIVHGKSEKQICEYIKLNLRQKMEIISKSKGENSIQINGIRRLLDKDRRFSSQNGFLREFPDVEIKVENRKKILDSNLKIFIIMDTDDCTEETKKKYISKELFKGHWAYEYIYPVFNSPELETIMEKAGIKFVKKGDERKKEYIKIFPTDRKYMNKESVELRDFSDKLKPIENTNLNEFIDFCLECST
jgi:hypothetical protein